MPIVASYAQAPSAYGPQLPDASSIAMINKSECRSLSCNRITFPGQPCVTQRRLVWNSLCCQIRPAPMHARAGTLPDVRPRFVGETRRWNGHQSGRSFTFLTGHAARRLPALPPAVRRQAWVCRASSELAHPLRRLRSWPTWPSSPHGRILPKPGAIEHLSPCRGRVEALPSLCWRFFRLESGHPGFVLRQPIVYLDPRHFGANEDMKHRAHIRIVIEKPGWNADRREVGRLARQSRATNATKIAEAPGG